MMASLLAPANPPGRISQLLPTVKCSNCNQPVPLTELGDHVCAPQPAVPTLPKPSVSPAAAVSLLPQRLQGRLVSPGPTSPRLTSNDSRPGSLPPRAPEPPQQRLGPSRINTASPGSSTYQQRSSPLARNEPDRSDSSPPAGRSWFGPPSPTNSTSSPHIRPTPPGYSRTRTISNAGSVSSNSSSPRTARPSFSSARSPEPPSSMRPPPPRDMNPPPNTRSPPPNLSPNPRGPPSLREPLPPPNMRLPPPPQQVSFVPIQAERDIDTKIGGEAGMAGVGRRGFAAAARAAMFVSPTERERPGGPQPHLNHRDNTPRYVNTDVPTRSNETPPLSAGPGYSSHSSGVSPYPQSPVGAPQHPPSPDRFGSKPPLQIQTPREVPPLAEPLKASIPTSPTVRMPFFEKFRNQIPGVSVPESGAPVPVNNTTVDTPSTAVQPPQQRNRSQSEASSASSYSILPSRSGSMSTTASRRLPDKPIPPLTPTSESGSEYGGLAYADSTDYEEEEENDDSKDNKSIKGKANPPPPLPLTSSILRSDSTTSTNHVRFPSTSDHSSERSGIRIPPSRNGGGHKRDTSLSSVSSMSSVGDSRKSNSAAIAHALGLSQMPPSEYGRLGGPGIGMGRRSTSGSSSSGSRSTHSRGAAGAITGGLGVMEREVKTLLEDANTNAVTDEQRWTGLSKSKSTGKQRSFLDNPGGPVKVAQRSNTVQGVVAVPEPKSPKLPARARTSTQRSVDSGREKNERVRKSRVCLKCHIKIEDGRWVQMDNAGVLCEKCWKNMYLPKCRRCNLPIEKQAVSSADGQLKGKYHRECFNCHTCHKPFPDKTFYVFDGKPLCAYHYHKENDSLCAAALCGQPIEGPCAVSHTGDRYHPEHMTCEYPGNPPCKERLEEYWEVEGRMLCERHAHASKVGSDDEGEGEEEWVQSSKALRRVTRFIDLGGSDLR